MIKLLNDVWKSISEVEDRGIKFIKGDNKEEFVSYKEMYKNSIGILGALQGKGIKSRDELLFQIEDNKSFIEIFWACIMGGIIPVPVSIGTNEENRIKTLRIWTKLNNPKMITSELSFNHIIDVKANDSLDNVKEDIKNNIIFIEDLNILDRKVDYIEVKEGDIAFIQFSSGSTGNPKGVMLTHKNLVTNTKDIATGSKIKATDSILTWLPLTHDMGLIGMHLTMTLMQINQYIMSTSVFIRRPILWIKKASQYKITMLSSPNFGYNYLLNYLRRKESNSELDIDLSSVRLIYNGAEPISISICNKFIEYMSKYNLRKNAILPCYGLAEASLCVTLSPLEEDVIPITVNRSDLNIGSKVIEVEGYGSDTVTFIDLGYPVTNCRIRISDDDDNEVSEMVVGHIQINGNNVTKGYYNDSVATNDLVLIDGWVKTGDLGFIRNNRLIVTGRYKDMIIINGQNYYAHDIENVIQGLDDIELGEIAACSISNREQGEEELVLFILYRKSIEQFAETANRIKNHVLNRIGLEVKEVVPVKKIPKTTSGKVQRYKMGQFYIQGKYDEVREELAITMRNNIFKEVNEVVFTRVELETRLTRILKKVLGVTEINIDDNFFELGGHSLKSIKIASMIHKEFNVEVPVSKVFSNPTMRQLGEYIASSRESTYSSIKLIEEKEVYKASSAQKRLFALNQFAKEEINYNIPSVMIVEGKLEKYRVEETFRKLVERHEAFRTSFELVNEEIVQRIHEEVEFNVEYEEISEVKEEVIKGMVYNFIRPFDLSKAPLLRAKLLGISEDKHILMIDMHHIVSDGTTFGIITEEFAKLYKGEELKPLRIQYKDYAAWENELLESEGLKAQEEYWMKVFSDEIPVLNISTDYARPTVQSFEGDSIDFKVNKELTEKIRKIGDDNGATMYMTLLSAYTILLSKYSGQEDIIVGSPIAGRSHADLEGIVGMFVNTLAMRNYPKSEKTFEEFLQSVKENALKAYENQDYQFDELVEKVQVRKDLSRNPLFDTMFVLQNMDIQGIEIDDLKFEVCNFENKISKFDLTLTAVEVNEEIEFKLEYCTKLFRRETVEKLGNHFLNILREIAENEEVKISEIEMLSEEEKRKILVDFNDTKTEYPKDKTIYELFEEQVEKTPNNIAVAYEDKELTYKDLNERANSLARKLIYKGINKKSKVGIIAKHSLEAVIGILAVIKSGAAYVPIDASYPVERINYMIDNSNIKVILTNCDVIYDLEFKGEYVNLEDEELYTGKRNNLKKMNGANDLVYIIYTSGSTGTPKGVMIEHRGLTNYIYWAKKMYIQSDEEIFALYSSLSFDLTVTSIFTPLISGNRINIYNDDGEGVVLYKILRENTANILKLTPAHLSLLCDEDNKNSSINRLIVGGENLKCELATKVYESFGGKVEIFNEYGPTETVVGCMIYKYDYNRDKEGSVPIGVPADNVQIYILDKDMNILPQNTNGEMYISGDGVARGYLGNEQLTAEKFVGNPYEAGKKMYKTGDLARWLPDGNIEFLGRIDNQVKIRGFRIELGEIENQLFKNEEIKEAVVVDKEDKDGNKYLCAYIVSEKEITIQELRGELSKVLPDYMIPSYFVQIEKMPLTPNGKVDRKALPEPEGNINTGVEYEAPRNELEEKLVEIWEGVLGVSNIGINDDFFSLGGDSIKSIQVISRAKAAGYSFEVKDLFNNSNIKDLGQCVKQNALIIEQGEVEGEVELTPIQKWFFEMDFEEKHHWNQAVMLFSKDGFEEELLEKAFKSIVNHHDALRMIYKNENNEINQFNRVSDGKLYDISIYDYRNAEEDYENEIKEICSKIQGSISLEEGPLVKLGLFKTNEVDHLLIVVHHLVIDGVSWRILFEDLAKAYTMAKKGEEITLQKKTTSFKEWAREQKKYANTYDIKKQLEYWNSIEEQDIKKLPKDKEADKSTVNELRSIGFELTQEETEDLLKNVNNTYNTEINDILLAALAITISKWTGYEDILINLESHGREEIIKNVDITRTIGWFTSQYPVVLKANNEDLAMMIKDTKDSLRRIPNKGIGHGMIKYLSKNELKDKIEFKLKPEISFNYLGQFDEDITNDIFSISSLDSGSSMSLKSKNLYSLDFLGILVAKRLNLNIRYNCKEYEEETIKLLIDNYKDNLINIINHCLSKEEKEKTAVDVTKENISLYELKPYLKDLNNIKKIYPLTPMQEGMLYHTLTDNDSEVYNETLLIKIKGQLDMDILGQSFNKLIERHDVLRTAFDYEAFTENMQIVFNERKTNVEYEDISQKEFDKDAYIQEIINKDNEKGYNLNKDILIKLKVIKTDSEIYNLLLSNHHIILDGWCLSIIMTELFKLYNELKYGYKAELQEVVPYSDYIEWLSNKDREEAKEYWKNYLTDYTEAAVIPFKSTESEKKYKNSELSFVIEGDITKRLEEIAKNNRVTVNTIMQSIWTVLLQKYNNSNDSVFGYVVSGRNPEVKGIENMLGLFINTIPLRVKLENKITFKELLSNINKSFLKNSEYDYCPLVEIQTLSEVKESLIDSLMVFENYPIDRKGINEEILNKNNFEIMDVSSEEQTSYNFNIIVGYQDTIIIKFCFNEGLYSKENVLKIRDHFQNIISQVVSNEDISVENIEILGEEEKHKLLVDFNDTAAEYSRDKTINELFEEQVERTPNNIAVVFGNKELSYRELNERANILARNLRERGIKSDSIVGLLMKRSIDMIVGVLGILKAGGAYLPISIEYPEDRIFSMLNDSNAKIVITNKEELDNLELKNIFTDSKLQVVLADKLEKEGYENQCGNLESILKPDSLLYVIYTSGSTGKPKGVMLEHKNMVNLVKYEYDKTNIDFSKKVLQFANMCFDVCYQELFSTLLCGGELNIISEDNKKDINKLIALIEDKNINIAFLPTAYLKFISSNEEYIEKFPRTLDHIIVAGEQLIVNDDLKEYIKGSNVKLHNHYGPSETHVVTTITLDGSEEISSIPPIGKPVSNTKIYILDKDMKIQPIGVKGEIYISGESVGRGYINLEELNNEKFVNNPYEPNQRMYKTGDLGRWLSDGNIEYLGRKDNQVKIRGFRIELGEVESALSKIEGIKETVVLDKDGSKYLCAYYVSDIEHSIGELREELKKFLPDYMIPSYFVKLEAIPLTLNGKVDRKALPEPEGEINTGAEYEAPRNKVEEKLVEIWQGVLGVSNIGINDNFFELGGHSLKATTLVGRIHKELNVEVPLKEIFSTGSIKGLSEYILSINKKEYEAIEKVEEKEYYEVSSAQKRMYMLQEFDKDSIAYNMSGTLEILGELALERLKETFIKLMERHEVLRTSFYVKEDMVLQRIHSLEEITFNIEEMEVQNEEQIQEKIKAFVRPFDLEQAPLLRVAVMRLEKARHIMLLDMHHIISDGVSISLITNEFSKLYEGKELEELKVQYKDYSAWQLKKRESEEFKKQEEYWLKEFSGEIPVLNLPTDYTRPKVKDFKGENISFALDKEITENLRRIAKENGTTMYMILLANLKVLLSKYSGQEDIVIGSAIAGRNHRDLENIIGMFVNTLAIRSIVDNKLRFKEYLKVIKEKSLRAYENQDYQFDELVEKLDLDRDLSRNPLFDVMFVLQNMEEAKIEIEDLTFKSYAANNNTEKFDITISVVEGKNEIYFSLNYSTSLYSKDTIERMIKYFEYIIKSTNDNPNIIIKDISLITYDEAYEFGAYTNYKNLYENDDFKF